MNKETKKSDFTSVVREDGQIHILKCLILDDENLIFQMYNKTNETMTPCFKIPASYGLLPWIKPDKTQKAITKELSSTKSVNRQRLVRYYNHFKFRYLVNQFNTVIA